MYARMFILLIAWTSAHVGLYVLLVLRASHLQFLYMCFCRNEPLCMCMHMYICMFHSHMNSHIRIYAQPKRKSKIHTDCVLSIYTSCPNFCLRDRQDGWLHQDEAHLILVLFCFFNSQDEKPISRRHLFHFFVIFSSSSL